MGKKGKKMSWKQGFQLLYPFLFGQINELSDTHQKLNFMSKLSEHAFGSLGHTQQS
jgi:hypothetical protein